MIPTTTGIKRQMSMARPDSSETSRVFMKNCRPIRCARVSQQAGEGRSTTPSDVVWHFGLACVEALRPNGGGILHTLNEYSNERFVTVSLYTCDSCMSIVQDKVKEIMFHISLRAGMTQEGLTLDSTGAYPMPCDATLSLSYLLQRECDHG